MATDALLQALSKKPLHNWPGGLADEPGIQDTTVPDAMMAYGVGSGLAGALKGVGSIAPDALAGEAGAIFPKKVPLNPEDFKIPEGFTKADFFTPAERQYKLWENTAKQYYANNDFAGALRAKWGMLKNSGGN